MQAIVIILVLLLAKAEEFQRIEVFGNMTIGYYYSKFYFGDPLQVQTLLLDTGSYLTVLTCSNCRICDSERLQSLYNPERSFGHAAIKCVRAILVRAADNPSARTNADATLKIASSLSTTSMARMLWAISSLITSDCRMMRRPIHQSRHFLGVLTSRRPTTSQ